MVGENLITVAMCRCQAAWCLRVRPGQPMTGIYNKAGLKCVGIKIRARVYHPMSSGDENICQMKSADFLEIDNVMGGTVPNNLHQYSLSAAC